MKHLDLFSGIGGFAYAADQVWGKVEHIFCDNDEFCRAVLRKHWPESEIYDDIRKVTVDAGRQRLQTSRQEAKRQSRQSAGVRQDEKPYLLTGGFPCQPFSQAGKRRGTDDNRYLWPEMLRVIREFSPTWVIGENVGGFVTWNNGMVLEQVCADLEAAGYEVQPFIIPACATNAPHRRDRVWIIAHSQNGSIGRLGLEREPDTQAAQHGGQDSTITDASGQQTGVPRQSRQNASDTIANPERPGRNARLKSRVHIGQQEAERSIGEYADWSRDWQEVAFATCVPRMDDGLPRRLVRLPGGTTITEARWRKEAIKAYGNAIVPQVAIEIMRAIQTAEIAPTP